MDSILLEPACKEMLLADFRDFLRFEDWYAYYFDFIWNKKGTMWSCRYAERGWFIKRCAHKRTGTYNPVSERDTLSPWLSVAWCTREVRS